MIQFGFQERFEMIQLQSKVNWIIKVSFESLANDSFEVSFECLNSTWIKCGWSQLFQFGFQSSFQMNVLVGSDSIGIQVISSWSVGQWDVTIAATCQPPRTYNSCRSVNRLAGIIRPTASPSQWVCADAKGTSLSPRLSSRLLIPWSTCECLKMRG